MKRKTQIRKLLILFFIGGAAYFLLEIAFRGHSYASMFVLGGLCFVLCGLMNEWYAWDTPLWKQQLICAGVITALEFVFGVVLNLYLGLRLWDYSSMPFQLLGQVCLPFTIAWFFLSLAAIVLDDYLRFKLFGEEAPRYVFF